MAGIELIDIHKTYRVDNREIPVLNGINLSLPAGRITVILGQSGCGENDDSAADRRTGDGGQR